MSEQEKFLKEKAILLMARERELHALRGKHARLGAWLALAQSLPEIVDPVAEFADICRSVQKRMLSALDLQRLFFLEVSPSWSLRSILGEGQVDSWLDIELGPEELSVLTTEAGGACHGPEPLRRLAEGLNLHRFLWYRMAMEGAPPVFLVAGYDQERTRFYPPFDEVDIGHFRNTGYQLQLLLGNLGLLKALARDQKALKELNHELERRVAERTRELFIANEDLGTAIDALQQKDRRMVEDIEEARRFQATILPAIPAAREVEFAVEYRPLEQVGGDIFDICELGPGHFRVFIADATGHGVQASMRTLLLKTEYDRLKGQYRSPDRLFRELTRRLVMLFPKGELMCTASCLDIAVDAQGADVAFTNAANPPILHWSAGRVREIENNGAFLGLRDDEWPAPVVFRLNVGDVVLIYSDGLSEQTNGASEIFESWLRGAGDLDWASTAHAFSGLLRAFDAFRGSTPLADDLTAIALRLAHPLA